MPSDNKVTILNHKQNINKIFYLYPISGQCSLSIPPENIRKPEVF